LLANVAHDRDLDKTPEFLLREHQMRDALLVQQLGEQAGRSMRVPDEAALDKYITDHPALFSNRESLQLDQMRFPMPADPAKLKALEADHSMDAVAARLGQMGIEFQRGNASLDTAVVPPAMLAQLQGLPTGEPFVVPQNGTVAVSSIIGRKPAPLTGAAARPVAVQLIRNEELSKVVKQLLDAKRTTTEIKYQNGFAPPKPQA
jgi:peptidyl-prolyl cis-trans isomerase C